MTLIEHYSDFGINNEDNMHVPIGKSGADLGVVRVVRSNPLN